MKQLTLKELQLINGIEWNIAHYGKYRLSTPLELKGKGIIKISDGKYNARKLQTYLVTEAAFTKIANNKNYVLIEEL